MAFLGCSDPLGPLLGLSGACASRQRPGGLPLAVASEVRAGRARRLELAADIPWDVGMPDG